MAAKRRKKKAVRKRPKAKADNCANCAQPPDRLPGYLLIALGAMWLPANYGLVPGFEWAKAGPLVLVLMGVVLVAQATLQKS